VRGLGVSPRGLLQNELVQRQIGDRLAQPAVLEFELLQALLDLQPAELLASAIVGDFVHTNLADRVGHVLTLGDQNIHLPQLPSLPSQSSLMSRYISSRSTSLGADQVDYET
jgi:hypothetical protein